MLSYADDDVIFAESNDELQATLNGLFLYYKSWNLTVNSSKTNIVIFIKKKWNTAPNFTFADQVLEVEDEFLYLGVAFDYKGHIFKQQPA